MMSVLKWRSSSHLMRNEKKLHWFVPRNDRPYITISPTSLSRRIWKVIRTNPGWQTEHTMVKMMMVQNYPRYPHKTYEPQVTSTVSSQGRATHWEHIHTDGDHGHWTHTGWGWGHPDQTLVIDCRRTSGHCTSLETNISCILTKECLVASLL